MKQPSIYIIINNKNTTLYIGVSSDLKARIYQHKNKLIEGFSATYHLHKLVYFEALDDMESAIIREKRLKKWNRAWKNRLISEVNPSSRDLYGDLF